MRDRRQDPDLKSRLGLLTHPSVISIGLAIIVSGLAIASVNIYRQLTAGKASTYVSSKESSSASGIDGLGNNPLVCWQTDDSAGSSTQVAAIPHNVTDTQQLLVLKPAELENKITSSGERSLIQEEETLPQELNNFPQKAKTFRDYKTQGIKQYTEGNYQTAVGKFKAARDIHKDSPESLIYLNNALANTSSKAYGLAIALPLKGGVPGYELDTAMAILKGAAHAQDEINRTGGIKGVPIKLLLVNDFENSPKSAAAVAQILTKKQDILGVVGHEANNATATARKVYQQSELASISPTSNAANLPTGSTFASRTVPNETIATKLLAEYVVNQGRNKVAVFYSQGNDDRSNRYSQPVQETLSNTVKASPDTEEIVKAVNLDTLDSDQSAAIINSLEQSINSEAIDTILLAPARSEKSIAQALEIATRSRALSKDVLIVGNEAMHDPRTTKCGEKVSNMVIATFWDIDSASSSVSTVTTEFAHKASNPNRADVLWDRDVNWISAMAYDAVHAFGKALEANHPSPNRANIANSLRNPRFSIDGATGFVKFDNNGDRVGDSVQLLKVLPVDPNNPRGGQYDFQPIFFD